MENKRRSGPCACKTIKNFVGDSQYQVTDSNWAVALYTKWRFQVYFKDRAKYSVLQLSVLDITTAWIHMARVAKLG